MKKTLISIALLTVLSTLAVSCQKDDNFNLTQIEAEQASVFKVSYSIDGITYQKTIYGEDAWRDFLNHMLALAEEGHRVSFRNENASSQVSSTKETITYTTTNHDDAYEWAEKKVHEGYDVTIEYDKRTGIYTCTAIK